MTDEQTKEIRRRLDEELSLDEFERDYRSTGEAATQFFQDLFVQVLNFEETISSLGDATWQSIPVHEWTNTVRAEAARLFAKSGNFRVIYVELEKLTRTAERNAIQNLTRSDQTSGWAIDGSFLTVFHAPDENIWHLVTPYEEGTDDITTGRPVLRRYTLGEGETHYTVAKALSRMDADKGRLAERIDDAFRVKPVTEDFYENYKSAFDTLRKELRQKGLEIENADRYAHTTLNRLMFFYYLQKKGWIGDRKDFVHWFYEQYEKSAEEDTFHEKWLSALFFDGMNQPAGEEINADLPTDVKSTIAKLPYMNGGLFQSTEEDELDAFLSDSALESVIQEFLEQYNFTVTEESPYDIDIAVDPAMLGKIYESLIAEQERGEAGIFYTPRVEVDMMCRMALYEQFCEYATSLGSQGRQRIIEFLFQEPQDWNAKETGEVDTLEKILHNLQIVDPACGSGAFLLGMKQVLVELYQKLGIESNYEMKERIIYENLYGVDIKDWAVRVAQFRLWLSLIEGEEDVPEQRPVLPNFSYKIEVGDSIVQQIDGELITLKSIERGTDEETAEIIDKLDELKTRFFDGEIDLKEDIEETQRKALKNHIDERIVDLKDQTAQQTLTGGISNESQQQKEETKKRIKKLRETKESIDTVSSNDVFLWDLDFSEVMLNGGFDIVIGNPPYVPKSRIIDQSLSPEVIEEMDDNRESELKEEYKESLRSYVNDSFDFKPSRHCDLYVYFYFKGLDILREGGTLSFVTSNAWLSQNYGRDVQEGLLKNSRLHAVVENSVERTFEDADINTVITIANRSNDISLEGTVSFASMYEPYANISELSVIKQLLLDPDDIEPVAYRNESFASHRTSEFRRFILDEATLWRLGGGQTIDTEGENTNVSGGDHAQAGIQTYSADDAGVSPSGSYSDGRWGLFFRAPSIHFELLEKGNSIDQVDSIADKVRRGIVTGADDFFYLPLPGEESKFFVSEIDTSTGDLLLSLKDESVADRFREQGFNVTEPMFRVERECVMGIVDEVIPSIKETGYLHQSGDDNWIPNFVIQSPKELRGIKTVAEDLSALVLMATSAKDDLPPGVTEYIKWGEEWEPSRYSKYPERYDPSRRTPQWYNLTSEQHKGEILFPKRVDRAYATAMNDIKAYNNQNIHHLKYEENPYALAAILNSSSTWLALELGGNRGLGGGALEVGVSPLKEVEIPAPPEDIGHREFQEAISEVDLTTDIYNQYGTENPEELTLDSISAGRRKLDDLVMGQIIGLTNDEQLRVCKELLKLVNIRIKKSESV
jgi:hypothetical protein